jgi:hypothetical protein
LNTQSKEGYAKETWTKNEKLWLTHFLPREIPNAKVLLFSYNSNVAFKRSAPDIKEQSEDLLDLLSKQVCQYSTFASPTLY